MQERLKYTIFTTKWGYFGLAGTESVLHRTCLPLPERNKAKTHLLGNLSLMNRAPIVESDKTLFKSLQEQITAYFEGVRIDFSADIPTALDALGSFTSSVLTACRTIEFGQVVTYGGLARRLGRLRPARAARAVGNALARNPMPLIIPCHRVIRSDGKMGGFSAPGGKDLKARLLRHEQASLASCKRC